MIIIDPIFVDLLANRNPKRVRVGDGLTLVLPDGYTQEEIEEFRKMDNVYYKLNQERLFANFADDDERPADVPKL